MKTERAEAKARGEKVYFTGRPCPKGHNDYRWVRTATCVRCEREIKAAYEWTPDLTKPCKYGHVDRAQDGTCAECHRIASRNMSEASKERKRNWTREARKNNPGKFRAMVRKRQASKLKATPKWANDEAIKAIYQSCPEGYHVDHIVPLQGKTVCGLHVEFNLQHLPESENVRKGNKFLPHIMTNA